MSWAEIKKAINSDLSTPLNSKIDAQTTTLANKFGLTFESFESINTSNSIVEYTPTKQIIAFCYANAGNTSFALGRNKVAGAIDEKMFSIYGSSMSGGKSELAVVVLEKDFTYYIQGRGTITAYSLGGVLNLLKSLTSTNLAKGGVLV